MNKVRSIFFSLALAPLLIGAASDFSPLEDYDDDAFLSQAPLQKSPDGLIGWSLSRTPDGGDRYIINFNSVSILEFIRFVARISNINFQFEEADLNFTITLISEEPLSIQNILSTLIQTLRARGFLVLEHESNLMITKSRDIRQIPTIVGEGVSTVGEKAPIITRVFRVGYANIAQVAEVIRPMMSVGSIVDVLEETRQLIVTDITTNVDQVGTLLKTLDSPHSNLEIEVYESSYISVDTLSALAKELLAPFSKDTTFLIIPHTERNSLFVVSNPTLLEKAMEVFEDLDQKPTSKGKGILGNQVYIYPIQNKPGPEMLEAVKEIGRELSRTDGSPVQLLSSLENVRWIQETNSLLFVTSAETQLKLTQILASLDTGIGGKSYFIYKLVNANSGQVESSLEELSKSLKRSRGNQALIEAISSMRFLEESSSVIFTGAPEALSQLEKLLPTFDSAVAEFAGTESYFLYTPEYLTGKELEKALSDIRENLSSTGFANRSILKSFDKMRWIPSTNTLLFTGDPASLDHIKEMIKLVDIPSSAPTKIFFYSPQFVSNTQIEEALDELAEKLDPKNLNDRNLASAIDNMTWVKDSQAFLFKADAGTIEKLQEFLKEIDSTREAESIAQTFFLYPMKFVNGNDLLDQLEQIGKSLPVTDPHQQAVAHVIQNISFLPDTNAFLITGPLKAVEDVKGLIADLDAPTSTPRSLIKTSFFLYKPVHVTPSDLEDLLRQTAADLKSSGLVDPSLLESIGTMRLVDATGSLVFTGTLESLTKTKELIATLDVSGLKGTAEGGQSFFVYKARYMKAAELLRIMQGFSTSLAYGGQTIDANLAATVQKAKVLTDTNSILFSGPSDALQKIQLLAKEFDSPAVASEDANGKDRGGATYVIYKPVNVSGPELIEMMQDFEQNLIASGIKQQDLFDVITHLKYVDKTGYILVSGPADQVEKVSGLLREFDTEGGVNGAVSNLSQIETSFLIYKLQYLQGSDLLSTLKTIGAELTTGTSTVGKELITAINSVQWIKVTNSLLATGNPEILTQLRELIENIDTPLRQVFIEVLIIQTSIFNNQEFGLQWGGKVQYLNRFAGGFSNFPSPNPPSTTSNQALSTPLGVVNATRTPIFTDIPNPSTTTGGLDLGVIGDIILHKGKTFLSLASLVTAIEQDSDSIVVLNPKVIAQDGQMSTIFVGQNIPFVGSTITTTQNQGTQTTSNIEYRDVGINLSITPVLGTGNMITLTISNDITSQVESTVSGPGTDLTGLQTSRTSLNAKVIVPNKHFVALSGVIQDTKSHFRSAIPCLGGLPVIGAVFSDNQRSNTRENVIFFLRPVIIDSVEEYRKITENQENLYKDLGVKQIVKEEIDEGIDWVKTPENE